ncbi:MAG TPA: GNAT family N-acetyltransferase [Actinomycetota bacterium]|nr:GNAT family N-acetyltransferase [Actinomycetota bacterium]
MSRFEIRPMSQAEAETVAAWHYEPPYDFYDFEADPEDHEEILDPVRRAGDYHSVELDGELAGFFSFRPHGDELELGLGLRPDLSGGGLGLEFVEAGLAFARAAFRPASFWLDVATWNERAKKVYERAGFEAGHVWTHESGQGRVDFLRMTRSA